MSAPGPVVCVVGPTASGKSALAEEVATRLESSVVSVDAMQVYRGMDVGTAKTPPAERRVPLLMVDVVDPTEDYSVRLFQRAARSVVDGLLSAGRVPVLCGGTGLYLNAVIDDMEFPAGEKGCASRERYERLAAERGAPALHALLAERDPESAALIHPNNVRRVVRALEMLDEGVSYARHHEGLHERAARYDARLWGLTMSRERLYRRIDERVGAMVDQGLLEEVRELASRGLTAELSAGQAIGYKELLAALAGETSLEEAVELVKRRTRRYAKRQLSWFRHDGRVRWIDLDDTSLDQAATRIVEDAGREAHGTI
ncbi:tRNA (adenosine(37)-N6)-dimethylallyltransferase MiaA [Thermophilibacter sp.]|uniref:tRNA (adenosine(37)-N6)-dimethylallyltransferase MiaA n=1 Tax=Thermophilibacter sp. TaxID=2847309 RepID=UPI003A93A840